MRTKWQPIETAPRDGTNIIVTDGKDVQCAYWVDSTNPRYAPGWWEMWECEPFNAEFPGATHWMPLPEPPE